MQKRLIIHLSFSVYFEYYVESCGKRCKRYISGSESFQCLLRKRADMIRINVINTNGRIKLRV